MSINSHSLATLVKVDDPDLASLFLRTGHHAHILRRTHGAQSLGITHSLNSVDEFQVLEVVDVDLVLKDHNNSTECLRLTNLQVTCLF